jgi:arabinan endo-1,5-alpha-L-arabinosidase
MKSLSALFLVIGSLAMAQQPQSQATQQQPFRFQPPPFNPTEPMVHDPVVAKQGNTYYLFCTGMGISVMSSADGMKTWKPEKPVFSEPPQWAVDSVEGFRGHIWAPDVIFYNGRYHVFYSCSAFAKNTSVIGHASTPTLDPSAPDYYWTDHGKVVQSVPNRDLWNAIDANIIIDEQGTPWMNFGSFWDGIKMVRLSKDSMKIAQPEEWRSLSRRKRTFELDNTNPGDGAVEAPFITKHGEYYYLFVSFDYCCRGANSDYKIVVGRSATVTGPYTDKTGISMAQGGGSFVLQGNEVYAGIGHCAVYNFDGRDYLFAHGYKLSENGASKLVVREVHWDEDGWPVVE